MIKEWTANTVAAHFRHAFRTLRMLPSAERQRYDSAGTEAIKGRCMSQGGPNKRVSPSPAAIGGLEQAVAWSAWLTPEERDLVWARAAKVPWKQICADLGCDRTTAWRRWQLALTMIAGRLNAQ